MQRSLSRWLSLPALAGMFALALAPVFAQTAPASKMGTLQGQVINPTGQPQAGGTINLSTDGGQTFKYTFDVDPVGDFSGKAAAGTYDMIYRAADTPKGKIVDQIKNVKIVAGQTTTQNDDMSRAAFLAKMTPEQRQQLEQLKKTNSQAIKANVLIKQLNKDLEAVAKDQQDIDNAEKTAAQQLGASASKTDIAAKAQEIKTARYTDIESMMAKDVALSPNEAVLWTRLGYAQAGLKKDDDAIATYKKAITLESAQKKPRMDVLGQAESGLGAIYARTGDVKDANAAFDSAAKDNPTEAPRYLSNEAIIFFQQGNSDAQVAAAEEAAKIDPNNPILYYLIGNGLVQKATVDPKTNQIVLPPGCAEAYQKYLDLAPDGQFAGEVKGILQSAGQKIHSSYRSGRG